MEYRASNYEKNCEDWKKRFLAMDKTELLRRLPELKEEDGCLTLCHYERKFGVDVKTGEIVTPEDDLPVRLYERLNIYTLFGFVQPGARLHGEWVTFDKLKNTSQFYPAFKAGEIDVFAAIFNGHADKLHRACLKLGGLKLPWSDAGYQLNAFECLPVRFLFWQGDDEFPSQANILFDAGATDFIHGESIVTVAMIGVERLAEAAGLELSAGIQME